MTSSADTWFDLTVGGRADDTFAVVGFTGEEALSALYRFDVTLCADSPDIDTGGLVGRTVRLRFSTFGQVRVIHGMVAEAEYLHEEQGAGSIYRVQLVPRLWRLTRTRQNRVLGAAESRSVVDLLADDLEGAGLLDDAAAAEAASGPDYALDLRGSFWQRRHTVQYGETDLDFLSRNLEAQGIFYLFDERGGKDVAVFADHGEVFPDVPGAAALPYRPADGMVHDAPSLRAFEATARPLPQKVVLKDYNYRLPHVAMQAEAMVDPDGIGTVVRYGDHFRTPEEGAGLARVKADALACRRLVVEGATDCVGAAAGRRFRLQDHPFRLYDGKRFLIERVVHEGWDPRFGVARGTGEFPRDADAPGYTNRFEGLEGGDAYRPEERTPRPVMAGVTHARIDAAGDGRRAELDDQGRYAVRLGFDVSGAAEGAASRPMRMMQPYGGGSQGMHFPLLKGTEVLLSAVDGHPDRPLILGAVPNPAQPSPVTNATSTRNRLRTTSGIQLEMEDGAAAASAEAETARLAQQQGASGDDDDALTSSTTWAKLSLSDYDGETGSGTDAYLRLGSADGDSETDYVADISAAVGDDWNGDGMLAFVSGTATRVTEGDRADSIGGDRVRVVDGDETDSIAGSRTTSVGYSDSGDDTLSVAGARDLVVAGDLGTTVSGDWTVSVDGDATISVGPDADVISHAVGGDLDITVDGKYTMSASGKFSRKIYGDAATTHGSAVGMFEFSHYITHTGATFQLYADVEVELYPEGLGHTSVSLDIQANMGLGARIYVLKLVTGTYSDFIGEKIERGVFKASENALKMRYANIAYAEDSLLVKAYTSIFKG